MNPPLTDSQIALIRLLQEEFPLCERPFDVLGDALGVSTEQVLEMTRELQRQGRLKRIAAALYHRSVGYTVNSMLVWDVPEDRVSEAAAAVTEFPQVTHCYVRNRRPEFDYNLYTMVHERSEARFLKLLEEMEHRIRPVRYASLRSLRELKKTGMKYFTEESGDLV